MTYTAVTFDNQKYPFPEDKLGAVQRAMSEGAIVRIGTAFVKGTDIRRIDEGSTTGEYGPHLTQEAGTLPALAESVFDPKYADFFWAKIVKRNLSRKAGSPFYHSSVVKWAKAESGYTSPEDILAFLDSEWDSAEPHNVPPSKRLDPEVAELSRKFFATEEGMAYAARFRR